MKVQTSAYEVAYRYLNVEEVEGKVSNPTILAMLRLDFRWPEGDEVPWCSAFANWIAWHLGLPRSKSLLARTWLRVGQVITLADAQPENDVVILKRGSGNQPGAENMTAPGHVGFFAGLGPGVVKVLGGNQGNAVSVQSFPQANVLGVRRLA